MKIIYSVSLIVTTFSFAGCSSHEKFAVNQSRNQRNSYEAIAEKFMIATQGISATKAATEIYAHGGNLIDAAIAASFAISVERPQSTGLGGGGFLLFRDGKSKKIYAVDFRERAPLAAKEKMYLDKNGNIIEGLSEEGILSAGTPGLVAGLWAIHQKFGKLPWSDLIQPAIRLAEEGFPVYEHLENALKSQKDVLEQYPSSKTIFLKENGTPYKTGELLIQKDLGHTLREIAAKGASVFYRGNIADQIVSQSKKLKGLLSKADLQSYRVRWRKPITGKFKDYEVVSFPPPSSGGVHVLEILNILENDPLRENGFLSPQAIHLTASAMQLAFADRAKFLGDPDFVKVPVKALTSKKYAKDLRSKIKENATSSDLISAGNVMPYESTETTNFSMIDKDGNAVVSTQTINGYFGSGVVVEGTGILLNNEMDDFSAKPGASNIYGAIGGTPNSIAPKKTPLSSMSPTLVLKDGDVVLGLGAPGGTRIITCVTQTILNYLSYGLPLYDSIATLRFHHQWKPDILTLEAPGPKKSVVNTLDKMGYKTKIDKIGCRVNAVARENKQLHGVADPRDLGASAGF